MGMACSFPKPIKRATEQRKFKAVTNRETAVTRARVFEREAYTCRICHRNRATEWAHLEDRGMGGNPDGSRDTTINTVAACGVCHQGERSIHSGHVKWRFLTDRGADGPMCWEWHEALPKAEPRLMGVR